jgi:lysozyme
MKQAIDLAAGLCRRFEGFRAAPYLCPAGVWTIGYGSTRYADGRPVRPGDEPIGQDAAERLLQLDLARFLAQVLDASPKLLAAHPARLAAILDFAYNLGAGRYRASTLRRRVEAGDWSAACDELMKWTRGGGRILPGLVLRRQAEVDLIRSAGE